jgi:glycosyltransferase involved in cell wall biosynthesis
MRKIFILTNTLKSGGAEKQAIYLTKALKDNYSVRLIVYYGNSFDQRMLSQFKGIEDQVEWLSGNHFSKLFRLYKLFRREKNAVVFSYLFTTNVINAFLGKIAGVKNRVGGMRSSQYTAAKFFIQRLMCNRLLSATVFNNYFGLKALAAQGFNTEKMLLIHNAMQISKPAVRRKQKHPVVVLSVGRFVEPKDYHTAFNVFAMMAQQGNLEGRIKYVVVGHGHLESDLRNYVKTIGIEAYVEFIINPPSVDPYYDQADIFLSTSLFEGLSNSIMEAMEASLPVVATDVGDNDKLVKNKKTGFLVPVKDVGQISENLFKLYSSHNLRLKMGLEGYEHLKKNFSMEKFKEQYISLIERLSDERKA